VIFFPFSLVASALRRDADKLCGSCAALNLTTRGGGQDKNFGNHGPNS
jgi:hypothetical protein